MIKLLLVIPVLMLFCGCNLEKKDDMCTQIGVSFPCGGTVHYMIKEVTYDGCQYLAIHHCSGSILIHKPNCKNHARYTEQSVSRLY